MARTQWSLITTSEADQIQQRLDRIQVDLPELHQTAALNTRRNQVTQRIRYNALVHPRSFRVGGFVMKKLITIGNTSQREKFGDTYVGPYRVTSLLGHEVQPICNRLFNSLLHLPHLCQSIHSDMTFE